MMRKLAPAALVVAFLLTTGCAATKQYVPLPDQTKTIEDASLSRIYLARPAFVGTGISMRVSDGDKVIGHTGPKGYLCWERNSGNVEISSKAENTSKLAFDAEAGSVYYIYQQLRPGVLIARNSLRLMDEDEGHRVLKKCKQPTVSLKD